MVSKRWEVILFLFSAATISYTLRVNISIAAQRMRDELGWSEREKGFMLSAFFWGYAIGQIPSTLAADRIGGKATLGFAIFASSVMTMLFPAASKISYNLALATRAIIGLCSAATFPSCFYFYPRWVPIKEKTFMLSFVYSGMYMVCTCSFIWNTIRRVIDTLCNICREKLLGLRCQVLLLELM